MKYNYTNQNIAVYSGSIDKLEYLPQKIFDEVKGMFSNVEFDYRYSTTGVFEILLYDIDFYFSNEFQNYLSSLGIALNEEEVMLLDFSIVRKKNSAGEVADSTISSDLRYNLSNKVCHSFEDEFQLEIEGSFTATPIAPPVTANIFSMAA